MKHEDVDKALGSVKIPVGEAAWRPHHKGDNWLIKWPLDYYESEYETHLEVRCCHVKPYLKFHISLLMPFRVWGIDHDPEVRHNNTLRVPLGVPKGIIKGAHFHAWEDNRDMAIHTQKPKMRFARPLSEKLNSLDDALKWFCKKTRINAADLYLPVMPYSEVLL